LTQADTDPLDYLESVCRREGLAVNFQMERGDMQFVNNRFVLHSRTAFEDHPEPYRRRNFLRLWMRYWEAG
jgi:alpha-ketoglutarate-dependent taurine dioxygenase